MQRNHLIFAYRVSNKDYKLSAPVHYHEFYQFLYLYTGSCRVIVSGKSLTLNARCLLIIPPGTVHEFIFPVYEHTLCEAFQIKCSISEDISPVFAHCFIAEFTLFKKEIENVLCLFERVFSTESLKTENALSGLFRFFAALVHGSFQNSCAPGGSNTADSRLFSTLAYIENNYKKRIPISFLAEMAGLNKSYYIRLFKKKKNMSPAKYINNLKFNYIKNMLIHTSEKMVFISQNAGYSNYYQFSDLFKKKFGMRPKDFRKKYS